MKFIADSMLGGLARYLRMLGFSTEYSNSIDDKELIKFLDEDEKTILLTKDRILKRENKKYGDRIILISSDDKKEQTAEVLSKLNIKDKISPFSRCLDCNSKLVKIKNKESVRNLIPEETYKYFDEFYKCPKCNKIFWFSTHTQRMDIIIQKILKKVEDISLWGMHKSI